VAERAYKRGVTIAGTFKDQGWPGNQAKGESLKKETLALIVLQGGRQSMQPAIKAAGNSRIIPDRRFLVYIIDKTWFTPQTGPKWPPKSIFLVHFLPGYDTLELR